MDLSLSGLASGFDWKTFIDQVMAVQQAPITKLNNEKTGNINSNAALVDLGTKLDTLKASVTSLGAADLFTSRKAASTTSGSSWTTAAAAGTPSGVYQIAVSQLASTARRNGAADLGAGLSTTDSVAGLTIATLPTATAVTAGTFTVNGKQVNVATTDTLAQVFTAIATATGGTVTASYDHASDTIKLDGGSGEVVLGAANDTSNFLTAMKLGNNGTSTVSSFGKLGTVSQYAPLTSGRLNADLSALATAGDSTFSINGVSISYNVNTDTLSGVLQRINQSGANVTAAYDAASDRVSLVNNTTGDTGIAVAEAPGGLMSALGLTTGSTLVRGLNAKFTINGGATIISASNTLDSAAHGITGLSVTVDTPTTQTVNVSGDTSGMRTAIEGFISSFNDIQSYIDDNTKITAANGKVTTSVLSSNHEVQGWADSLRSMVFGSVSGLSGTISRLENLGIDFASSTSRLEIKDGTKLDAALRDKAGDVAQYFQTDTTGLTARLSAFVDKITKANADQQTNYTKTNAGLDTQIANIQRRLDQQKQQLTDSFVAMENAQSKLTTQSKALDSAFGTTSTSTKKA
jgi:flagellar hook-associated protein 2